MGRERFVGGDPLIALSLSSTHENFKFLRISHIECIVLYIMNACVSVWVESVEKLRG